MANKKLAKCFESEHNALIKNFGYLNNGWATDRVTSGSMEGRQTYLEFEYNDKTVQALFEENKFYGSLLKCWAIDGNEFTTVQDKFSLSRESFLHCQSHNELCGTRAFEKGSIQYEFFLKPLGIPLLGEFEWGHGISIKEYTLTNYLQQQNIKIQPIQNG